MTQAKTWLITGTSSGFGKELATIIAQNDNLNLVAAARNLADLTYLDQYDHGQIAKVMIDVTQPDTIEASVSTALAKFTTIDVLVNNAGIGYFATIEESDLDQVQRMFEVNVFGLAKMTKAVLPSMRQQRSGIIVNISSALALTTVPTMGFYSASKYAVEGYTDTLRQEVSDLGIKVLTVEPSGARTNWAGRSSQKTPTTIKDYQKFDEMIKTTDQSVEQAPGDPKLVAQIIFEQVTQANPIPNHLPLGEFAYNGSLQNLSKLIDEIKAEKDLSMMTDN